MLCLHPVMAQPVTPPADGIADDTHALSDSSRSLLVAEMSAVRKDLGIAVWLSAGTFLESGQTWKKQARELRQAWRGGRAPLPVGVLVVAQVPTGTFFQASPW